jgi:hypothetical protein
VGLRAARWFWELLLTWLKLPPAIRRLPAISFSDRTWSFAEGAHGWSDPVATLIEARFARGLPSTVPKLPPM